MSYVNQIPFHEFLIEVTRSSGPGGQNVNRTNSAVILRWNVLWTLAFSLEQKQLLIKNLSSRLTKDGELLIRSEEFRDQEANRKRCFQKLEETLMKALFVPKKRKKTRPTRGSVETRHKVKKQRGHIKKLRQRVNIDEN